MNHSPWAFLVLTHQVKYAFWMVSIIPSRAAPFVELDPFLKPKNFPKWFHMNSIIMSANTLKGIFEILYTHCTYCGLEKNVIHREGPEAYISFYRVEPGL